MSKSSKVRNWNDYNQALVKRGSIAFNFNENYLETLYYQDGQVRGGKIQYSAAMYEYLLMIKVMFRLPWRATIGFAKGLLSQIFPDTQISIPHYAHADRMAAKLKMKIKTYSLEKEIVLSLDSTGIHVYTTSGWHQRKYGKETQCKRKESWKKIHIAMDLNTQQIVAMEYTDSTVNDCEVVPALCQAVAHEHQVTEVIADGAYDTKAFYKIIYQWQAKAIIPPACTSTPQHQLKNKQLYQSHLKQRDQIIKKIHRSKDFFIGLKRWKIRSGYHRRSLIETCMFRLKRTFGFYFHHQTIPARTNEMIAKVNLLNLMASFGLPKFV